MKKTRTPAPRATRTDTPAVPSRLALRRESIRVLDPEVLERVVGGDCPNGSAGGSLHAITCN